MHRTIPLLLAFSGLLPAQLTREGAWWVKTVTGAETLPADSILSVVSRGDVVATGISDRSIRYEVKVRTKARTEKEAEALLAANSVLFRQTSRSAVLTVRPGRGRAEVRVQVPRTLRHTTLSTMDGSVQLYDLKGPITATACGNMKADRIYGDLEMRTSGGDIWLGQIAGAAHVSTQGGPIVARFILGDAVFDTGAGDIIAQDVGGLVRANTMGGSVRILKAGGAVRASTGGGPIEVGQAGGEVQVRNAAGPVHVGGARGVTCENAAGGIRLNNVSGALRASTALGSILAQVLAGRPLSESFLTTGSGDITVVIPSNVGVRIYALSELASGNRRIISEFPGLTLRQQGSRMIAEGDINGGGPLMRIAGTGGTIFIKRK